MVLNRDNDLIIFKSNHDCEKTLIKIDVAILDKKIAFIYVPA